MHASPVKLWKNSRNQEVYLFTVWLCNSSNDKYFSTWLILLDIQSPHGPSVICLYAWINSQSVAGPVERCVISPNWIYPHASFTHQFHIILVTTGLLEFIKDPLIVVMIVRRFLGPGLRIVHAFLVEIMLRVQSLCQGWHLGPVK